MDGNMDTVNQVRLMRSVMGRKMMEIDEFNDRAEQLTGEEAGKYADMMKFLENDIAGYKTIIGDLRDGNRECTGDLCSISSLPAELVGLYNDFYLPMLGSDDRAEEDAAMALKSQYAEEFARVHCVKLGQKALANDIALDIMASDMNIAATIGEIVLQNPELLNLVSDEQQISH